jgi:hypothetical protein
MQGCNKMCARNHVGLGSRSALVTDCAEVHNPPGPAGYAGVVGQRFRQET